MNYSKLKIAIVFIALLIMHLYYGSVLTAIGALLLVVLDVTYSIIVVLAIYSFIAALIHWAVKTDRSFGYRAV